jgi:mono/diheme cytochrome c family protein
MRQGGTQLGWQRFIDRVLLYQEERATMRIATLIVVAVCAGYSPAAYAAAGNADSGRQLVMRSCSSCHTTEAATIAGDAAPPFSAVAKTNKERPAWIRGWLMAPHPPMPSIPLSRQQINDIIAYLGSLPTN